MPNAASVAIVTMTIGGASNVARRTRLFRDGPWRANAEPPSVVGEKSMTDAIAGHELG
jgi:hypothetical protein